ncbi:MAG: thiolase family protein [Candidatus Brocadiia bacterium]
MPQLAPSRIAGFRRTPIAKRGGELSSIAAVELSAAAGRALLGDLGQLVPRITHAVYGSSRLAGQGPNPARRFALMSGLPDTVPAVTITCACSSGIEAVIAAWRMVALGEADIVLVGAGESMSQTPSALFHDWHGEGGKWKDLHISDGLMCPITGMLMAEQAEALARDRGFSRATCDSVALTSHRRYEQCRALHESDIAPIDARGGWLSKDVLVRGEDRLPRVHTLDPLFGEGGIHTAATVSAVADGGAAMLIGGADIPCAIAELAAYITVAGTPDSTCTMPVNALTALGQMLGRKQADFGALEINEGFASQLLACCADLEIGPEQANPFGGTLACGHPTGMTGLRLLGLHARALSERQHKDAVVAVPVSGGMATAVYLREVRR